MLYFTAEREPVLVGDARSRGSAARSRRRSRVSARSRFRCCSALRRSRCGFATVTGKSARVAHPILQHTAWNTKVSSNGGASTSGAGLNVTGGRTAGGRGVACLAAQYTGSATARNPNAMAPEAMPMIRCADNPRRDGGRG